MAKKKKAETAMPSLDEEMRLWDSGCDIVFGVDEAGRGCLAGPVCAGVLAWGKGLSADRLPAGIRDSKILSEAEREAQFEPIRAAAYAQGVGFAERAEIDRWNILEATSLGVARALESALAALESAGLVPDPDRVGFLADGNLPLVARARFFCTHPDYRAELARARRLIARPKLLETCLVKGDDRSLSIAAASILAKVSRDRRMLELDARYPDYEFRLHKGYFTARHKQLLAEFGPCLEHRRSFAPVREIIEGRGLF